MKKAIIIAIVVLLVIGGVYYFIKTPKDVMIIENQNIVDPKEEGGDQIIENKMESIIGRSAEGRDITAYHYGTGDTEILFVGGIHGGYEWNTVLVAYELMDYLKANPNIIPSNERVTVIPVLNPDGLNKVVGTTTRFTVADVPTTEGSTVIGRFNGNNVDLNRNFACDWQAEGMWQNKTVSGGTEAFSEPESQAIKNYIENQNPKAVIVWYSAANGVFSSSCHNGVSDEAKALTNTYAKASGYPAFAEFNFYEITGDMMNWLAKENIPAISVLLTNHTSTEWSKNKAGIDAVLKYFAE